MRTSPVTRSDWGRSVVAVPPLARIADGGIDEAANAKMIAHVRGGGITTFLYGGNADLYNYPTSGFAALIDFLGRAARADEIFIPSVGPDFGKALDQALILRASDFPTMLLLPQRFPATPRGTATGIRRLVDTFGKPIIVYLKHEDYLALSDLRGLIDDGVLAAVKYGIERDEPADDPHLVDLVALAGDVPVLSGMGELPAIVHLTRFGLAGFTSGGACIAPRLSMALLHAVKRGDQAAAEQLRRQFVPLEDVRAANGAIPVLHAAVTASGLVDMGPVQPFLSDILAPDMLAKISATARALLAEDFNREPETRHALCSP